MNAKRNTIQRRLILDAMKELDVHANAEQIYDYIKKKHSSVSKATVYRNLRQMVDMGDLLSIGDFYGSTHYDHNPRSHHHFVCENCRKIFDVEGRFSDLREQISGIDGFDVKGYNLNFKGLCELCR
ncbi:MAG: transcriptional repressor [Chitinivibrionia bacterium]|nr:transcriptional repressor [Chitinivibrionia bacterium]